MNERSLERYDANVASQHSGSITLTVGWTLLAMSMIVGIYCFQDIREGTHFWLAYDGSMALLGLLTAGYGQHLRRSPVRISHRRREQIVNG